MDIDQLRKMNPNGIGRALRCGQGIDRLARAGLADDLIEQSWVVEGRNPSFAVLWYLSLERGLMTHPNFNDGITEQEAKILHTLEDRCPLLDAAHPRGAEHYPSSGWRD